MRVPRWCLELRPSFPISIRTIFALFCPLLWLPSQRPGGCHFSELPQHSFLSIGTYTWRVFEGKDERIFKTFGPKTQRRSKDLKIFHKTPTLTFPSFSKLRCSTPWSLTPTVQFVSHTLVFPDLVLPEGGSQGGRVFEREMLRWGGWFRNKTSNDFRK